MISLEQIDGLAGPDGRKFLDATTGGLATKTQAAADTAKIEDDEAKAKVKKAEDRADAIQAEMDKFYENLNKPLDFNDPEVAYVINQASARAGSQAKNRGIEGPMSVNMIQGAEANARNALGMQRKGLAASVLGQRAGYAAGMAGNAADTYNQNAMQNYQNRLAQSQGAGALIGGAIGGIGGFIAGGPMGAGAGMTAGSQLGGGLGGMSAGGPPQAYSSGYSSYRGRNTGY